MIQDLAGVGYALSSLDTQIATLSREDDRAERKPRVEGMLSTLRTAQRLLHDDLLALRELTGMQYAADSPAVDPAAALRVVADHVCGEGTPVETVLEDLPDLPPAHRAALIRVGREALRNAAKHAPGSHVVLSLGVVGPNVVLAVTDDGPGFDPHNAVGPVEGHIGLALLVDAAEGAGGRLDVRSRPGHGTTVKATIPIPRAD